jgi:NitT/TauT family transport system permease protein
MNINAASDQIKASVQRSPVLKLNLSVVASFGLLAVAFTLWQVVPKLLGVPSFIFPTLSDTVSEIKFLVGNGNLIQHTVSTALNVAIGFGVGSIFGMALGYFLGLCKPAEVIASPYLLLLQIAPKVAFAPLFIMWFGFTAVPKILVTTLMVFFPVAINVLTAMRGIDPDLIRLARSLNATRAQLFWKIQFRASLPELMAGLRIGATLAVVGVVVGEMVGGNTGLGYLLIYGQGQANTAAVFASILILTLIGVVAYLSVIVAEKYALAWRPPAVR